MSAAGTATRGFAAAAHPAGTALLLLAAAVLCGLRLPEGDGRTLAFEAFGFVEGALALLVLYVFLRQRAIAAPATWLDRLLLAYWLGATAVVLRLVLPPPGLGYWIGVAVLSAALLGAFGGGDRRRTVVTLGVGVVACATLRFAVIPFVWRNASLPDVGPIELGGVSDWAKGLVTEYAPVRPGNEVLNVLGLAAWALALRRSWPPDDDPLAALDERQRDRLLQALISRTWRIAGESDVAGRPVEPPPEQLLLGGEPPEPRGTRGRPPADAPRAPVPDPGPGDTQG